MRPEVLFQVILGTERFITVNSSLLKALETSPKIKTHWTVPEDELPEYFRNARVLLCLSTGYESLPTVIIEAIASGCLPIAPSAWGITEVIKDKRLLFDEGNEKDIFNKLDSVLANHEDFGSYHLISKRLEEEVKAMNDAIHTHK